MKLDELLKIRYTTDETQDILFAEEQFHAPHSSYEWECMFFSIIRRGDIEAYEKLRDGALAGDVPILVGRLSRDELRQVRYLAVSFITLAIRAAIQGGMPETDAYVRSDVFIQTMDRMADPTEILASILQTADELVRTVHAAGQKSSLTPAIRKCRLYIDHHLTGRISLPDLARECRLAPAYLSARFHAETGLRISEYILKARIERAKDMLRHGKYSAQEISEHLCFCSQSHFIACFRKETGQTPRRWCINE